MSLTIDYQQQDRRLATLAIAGRLDAQTAPELDAAAVTVAATGRAKAETGTEATPASSINHSLKATSSMFTPDRGRSIDRK